MAHCAQAPAAPPAPQSPDLTGEGVAPSRLSIRTHKKVSVHNATGRLARLRALFSDPLNTSKSGGPSLKIENLRGQEWFSQDDVADHVELLLPPDTYQVTASFAGLRRSYTLALEKGRPFELQIRFAADSQ
jgi:hypothetical protein